MQVDSKPRSSRSKVVNYLVGAALDEAEAAGESLDIFWPFDDSEIRLWEHAEAIWYGMHTNYTSALLMDVLIFAQEIRDLHVFAVASDAERISALTLHTSSHVPCHP